MNPESPAYKWWIALTVVPAGLVSAIDGTSVSIAIPNMMTSLRADLDQIQWVITISLIMQTLLMPTAGWLTGLLGRRKLFITSLGIVIVGTLLCSITWSLGSLIFFRAIIGLGGGVLQPVSMALLFNAFPREQRGTAMGLFNTSIALGLIIGRFGGFMVDAFDWRMIFYLTLPFSVSSVILGFIMLPAEERQPQQAPVDVWGILTMGGFLVPLMLVLTQGRFEGWDSPYIRGLFATAAVSAAAFIIIELRSRHPLVDLRLYSNFNFTMGSVVQFLVSILFMSSTFLINIFLQRVLHFTPTQVGVLMFPQGFVYGIGSFWAGRLSDYMNPRIPLVLGLICFAIVYFWLGGITAVATSTVIMAMLCLRSFSFSCVNSPNTFMALQALPDEKVGMATGLFSVARGIAGTLGVALTASFLEQTRTRHAMGLAQQQGGLEMPAQWTMRSLQQIFAGVGDHAQLAHVKASAHFHTMLMGEATILAYQDIFLLSAFISLFNIIPGLLRSRKRPERAEATAPAPTPVTEDAVESR